MIVEPYLRAPKPPVVCLLLPDGAVVSEHGDELDLDDWPKGHLLWTSYETAYSLTREGRGEALCWRGEEIRWRHQRVVEDGWTRRASDANVIKLPFSRLRVETQLGAFGLWRDWLASHGASPTGTSGSAAWSLLRSRLTRRLVTSSGQRPPLRQTVGGRQELGPSGQGHFAGSLVHLDLPAAYASTLAGLRYGGVWLEATDEPGRQLDKYVGGSYPVFVRARVKVPEGFTGPLLRRPRRLNRNYLESELFGDSFPTGTTIQGFWTYEEIAAAEAAGARVTRLGGWIHRSGWYPFAPWWDAIQEGRSMGGLAGQLAKMTGNALWGRFCMDPAVTGRRTVRSTTKGGRLRSRPVTSARTGFVMPAHDLAETVSGRVRAALYTAMLAAGDGLVSAHTDGLWMQEGLAQSVEPQVVGLDDAGSSPAPLSWRVKEEAAELDLLGPQQLRYRPRGRSDWWHCVSGVPAERAAEFFEREWIAAGYGEDTSARKGKVI